METTPHTAAVAGERQKKKKAHAGRDSGRVGTRRFRVQGFRV